MSHDSETPSAPSLEPSKDDVKVALLLAKLHGHSIEPYTQPYRTSEGEDWSRWTLAQIMAHSKVHDDRLREIAPSVLCDRLFEGSYASVYWIFKGPGDVAFVRGDPRVHEVKEHT